jgi:hypothetical protein
MGIEEFRKEFDYPDDIPDEDLERLALYAAYNVRIAFRNLGKTILKEFPTLEKVVRKTTVYVTNVTTNVTKIEK